MTFLLDTHVFIWWTCDPERIPAAAFHAICNPKNTLFFSTASSWEIQIKLGTGKLSFTEEWETILNREIEKNGIKILPINLSHTFALKRLPPLHRDPFDRMLIAQALTEELTFITNDAIVQSYPDVTIEWD